MRGVARYAWIMRIPAWLATNGLFLLACGNDASGTASTTEPTSITSSGPTGEPTTTGSATGTGTGAGTTDPPTTTSTDATTSETTASTTTASTTATTDATTGEPGEPDPWTVRRGVMHMHSPYSHDACDGEGLMGDTPNPGCLADLRAALCASGHDFVMLTDHPAHMQEHPFEQVLLYSESAGDLLVSDGDATYNRMRCTADRSVVVAAGYESTHTMPLGLHHHVDPALYAGLTDEVPLAEAKALIDGLEAGGAVTAIAHSEESDLSAARIVEVGLDAMEWYNPHGNFKTALGGDNIAGDPATVLELLQGLLPFMAGSNSGAHPDLVYLRLLPKWPVEGFAKWREVQRSRPVTGIFGSDVHQNVSVDPICANPNPVLQATCVAAAKAVLPDALVGLVAGGTLTMSDGDRLDSYLRILRWLENRVLTPPGELDLAQLQDSLRAGRSYGLFSVFGDPEGLRFAGRAPDESTLWIGDAAPGPVALELRVPARPVALGGAAFTPAEGDQAELRAELWRTDAKGSTKVHESTGLGAIIPFVADQPGAYHVELWLRPQHLRGALGSEKALADGWFLWVITNPIRVTP